MRRRVRPPVPGFFDDVHGKRGAVGEQRRLAVAVERRQGVPEVGLASRVTARPIGRAAPRSPWLTECLPRPDACALKPEYFAVISRQELQAWPRFRPRFMLASAPALAR